MCEFDSFEVGIQGERKSIKKQQERPENIKIHTCDVQISVEVLHGTFEGTPG